MKCLNKRYEISLAGPAESRQLLAIYESGEFQGNISVLYTRRPDPYESLQQEGDKVLIPVVIDREKGVIAGMGACILRRAYVNGQIRRTAYLTGLKALPEYRRRILSLSIAEVYYYLHELTKAEVDVYYTTILQENLSARKMLEKKRKNMPEYRCRGEYTVYCLRTGARFRRRSRELDKEYLLNSGSREELAGFYREKAGSFNLAPAETNPWGLGDKDIWVLRTCRGEIAAACALWNQQSYKQYIITAYKGLYKYLKKMPLSSLGYPRLPRENVPVNYASLALLSVRDNDALLAEYFLRRVAEKAGKYDFLMLGLFENHPLTAALAGLKAIRYQSRLYTVHWPEEESLQLDKRPLNLEVGFL
jgi:hypothetical protein